MLCPLRHALLVIYVNHVAHEKHRLLTTTYKQVFKKKQNILTTQRFFKLSYAYAGIDGIGASWLQGPWCDRKHRLLFGWMFYPCLSGFPQGSLVSFHYPKACVNECVNVCTISGLIPTVPRMSSSSTTTLTRCLLIQINERAPRVRYLSEQIPSQKAKLNWFPYHFTFMLK